MSDLRASIAAELAKHPIVPIADEMLAMAVTRCLCGEILLNSYMGGAPIEIAEWHAAHVATILTALLETELREARAEAWDAGFELCRAADPIHWAALREVNPYAAKEAT